ncbi:MAG: hypothetical protein MPF33_01965 [Candidatus Aramenus sp.]|jgi:hypothetical protein|nr:hypothetical protein [Candidatus Aramenus sp.]
MGVRETEKEIIIEVPFFEPVVIPKEKVEKVEEGVPPDELCSLISEVAKRGVLIAGTTIDGKVSYYNISPNKKCIKITLKDGRVFYVNRD